MGNQSNPNIVFGLRDLSDGSLDSGKTVELIPYGNTYPTGAIALTEIGVTGVYKKETASGVAAVAQGVYLVFVGAVFAGVYVHGGEFLQSHLDNVSDPHSVAGVQVSISDSGGYFATDNVEAALQALGAHMNATNDPHNMQSSQITDDSAIFVTAAIATELNSKLYRHRSSTKNQGDSTPPDTNGGGTVWADLTIPNDTTAILLDNSINWRDRAIHIVAYLRAGVTPADYIPGGANDNDILGYRRMKSGLGTIDGTYIADAIFYSKTGSTDGLSGARGLLASSGDDVAVYANSTNGNLYINKTATASASVYPVLLKIEFSPVQNH